MNCNLTQLEKVLRKIAKHSKSIRYTKGLLFAFIMTGMVAFSAEVTVKDKEIEQAKVEISDTVKEVNNQFRKARLENKKILKNANLDLIQLMEQGDQVIKSPWSSWQFGVNYMYDGYLNSGESYRGSGDKEEKYVYEGIYERDNDIFVRNTSPLSSKYSLLSTNSNIISASTSNRLGLTSLRYGLVNNNEIQEPIIDVEVSAAIKPKSIKKTAINLQIPNVAAPTLTPITISPTTPPDVEIPKPGDPNRTITLVKPNANPFTGFFFDGSNSAIGVGNSNLTLYAGLKASDLVNGIITPAAQTGAYNGTVLSPISTPFTTYAGRPTNILYRSSPNISNMTLYVRGNFASDTYIDTGSGVSGGSDPSGGATLGTIGIHTLLDGSVFNVTANLYGRAGFLTAETWRHGKVTMNNTNVNVYGSENSVYYIMPAAYSTIAKYYSAAYHEGALLGETNVKMYGTNNTVYLSSGISASRRIENTGIIELEGASNIVYSGMGYTPNWQKTQYGTNYGNVEKMNSAIKLTNTVNLYGDENVTLYFGSKMGGNGVPKSWELADKNNETLSGYLTKASYIGIYQGEIQVNSRIGTQLAIDSTATKQTLLGQINDPTNKPNYGDETVDGSVGIYAISGQRAGIVPSRDLGVPAIMSAGLATLDDDTVHNLEIGNLDIRFGKYSKNGFMIISKLGTVIDIGKSTTNYYVTNNSTSFTDGINGTSTTEADAAVGTVVAYAEGTWDQQQHQLGSTAPYLNANNSLSAGSTASSLQGKPSEINIHIPLTMTSKEGIAYFADNSGIVNVKSLATTVALGHKSIIGYAREKGVVTIDSDIQAQDGNATSSKYQNIGIYAGKDGTVNLNGKSIINGIGAFANGSNAKVYMNNISNVVNTGVNGGLIALNGGYIEFNGGDVNNKDNDPDDHRSTIPFYSDANGSKINFTGSTNINMSNGVLMIDDGTNYTGTSGSSTKYNGMSNVTVNLLTDNVIIKSISGENTLWLGGSNFLTSVKSDMKLADLKTNSHSYKVYYADGTFEIATNVDLDSSSDAFNNIVMTREIITIDSGMEIKSILGKGLSMGGGTGSTSNSQTGYINNGTINITGGTLSSGSSAINTSFGTILNNKDITIDNGIGIIGVNGTKITNNSTGTIKVTNSGVGIAGFTSGTSLQAYGTDKLIAAMPPTTLASSIKVVDITNNGAIEVSGTQPIAIYAENNNTSGLVKKENISVNNNSKLVLGDKGIGILVKGAIEGGIITVTGTGSSDIVTGKNGIGIYAENSELNLNSNYGIETKDNGVGIYLSGASTLPTSTTLEYKYSGSTTGTGIGIAYSGSSLTNTTNINILNSTLTTAGIIGLYSNGGGTFTNSGNITGTSTVGEFGIVVDNNTNVINNGNITLGSASSLSGANVGIYSKNSNTITNNGTILTGDNTIGIYAYGVNNTGIISVGNAGTGIYTQGGNVNLSSGTINIGLAEAVGVYSIGSGQTITNNLSALNIGDTSFGFVNLGTGNTINSNTSNVTLGNDSVYIYSNDASGTVANNTNLVTTGSKNYGIYSAGQVTNSGNMNLSSGVGNVGIYSISGGTATNSATIDLGTTDVVNKNYSIGMAAGYSWTDDDLALPISLRPTVQTGNIVNSGIINVNNKNDIGMYATESASSVTNSGIINLNADNTIGVYLDNGAKGTNTTTGIIKSASGLKNVLAVYVRNGAVFENYGEIKIDATNAVGALQVGGGIFINHGIFNISGSNSIGEKTLVSQEATKIIGGVEINVPVGATTGVISLNGEIMAPTIVNTTSTEYKDISTSSIGMYIDTSGVNYTAPIIGISALNYITESDLIIGAEAAESTNSKYIQVGQNIIEPYNLTILANPQITKWNIYSGSLTWMATAAVDTSKGTISNIYMAKIPYTTWANDTNVYNFADGLEQRYGVESLNSREKELFNKLNGIGNNESILLSQAYDEMMGHQYANTQQRLYSTSGLLNKEFDYLANEWSTKSKESNKIKVFGMKGEYNTDTAGIINYKNDSYGVAYVHEDETLKLGANTGWYAGVVNNTFKFKDIGGSKENTTIGKLGIFKTTTFDNNGSLKWKISGEGMLGYSDMDRRFLVVDEIFGAKSTYTSYGLALRNELSKEIRLSERTSLKPYGSIDIEYGKYGNIKEETGEIRLEVKGNDYYSIKPELGLEYKYKQPLFVRTNLVASIGVAYENELGKVNDADNRARVAYTNADYFNLRGEKENREGNVKGDLKLGIENSKIGFTFDFGYDTEGENVRGGVGFRAIY